MGWILASLCLTVPMALSILAASYFNFGPIGMAILLVGSGLSIALPLALGDKLLP